MKYFTLENHRRYRIQNHKCCLEFLSKVLLPYSTNAISHAMLFSQCTILALDGSVMEVGQEEGGEASCTGQCHNISFSVKEGLNVLCTTSQ